MVSPWSYIGQGAALGLLATRQNQATRKRTRDKDALETYRLLIQQGARPISERGSATGSVITVGDFGMLEMPDVTEAESRHKIAQLNLQANQALIAGNIDKAAHDKFMRTKDVEIKLMDLRAAQIHSDYKLLVGKQELVSKQLDEKYLNKRMEFLTTDNKAKKEEHLRSLEILGAQLEKAKYGVKASEAAANAAANVEDTESQRKYAMDEIGIRDKAIERHSKAWETALQSDRAAANLVAEVYGIANQVKAGAFPALITGPVKLGEEVRKTGLVKATRSALATYTEMIRQLIMYHNRTVKTEPPIEYNPDDIDQFLEYRPFSTEIAAAYVLNSMYPQTASAKNQAESLTIADRANVVKARFIMAMYVYKKHGYDPYSLAAFVSVYGPMWFGELYKDTTYNPGAWFVEYLRRIPELEAAYKETKTRELARRKIATQPFSSQGVQE